VGLFFLVLGFTSQFLGASDIFPSGPANYWWAILTAGARLLVAAFLIVRHVAKRFSQHLLGPSIVKSIQQILDLFDDNKRTAAQLNHDCSLFGKALDCKRKMDQDDKTYLRRLGRFANDQ